MRSRICGEMYEVEFMIRGKQQTGTDFRGREEGRENKKEEASAYGREWEIGDGMIIKGSEKRQEKKREETEMNTLRKLMALLVVCGMVGIAGKVYAGSTESLVLIVLPAVNYSVAITSATDGEAYNFGTVDLNATTLSERPAFVQNNGDIVSEWQVSAITALGVWELNEATGTQNYAVLKALFNSVGGIVPVADDYDTVNGSTITSLGRAAENNSLSTTPAIVTNIPILDQRELYFMMHTPETSSTGDEQRFRVYVTAVAP